MQQSNHQNIILRIGNDSDIQSTMEGKRMDTIAMIISIIGSINWGLIGLFQFDLVAWIFGGQDAIISRIIYGIVGLAGLWCVTMLFRRSRPMIDGE